ncbi:hypothetical protein [Pedobacter hiemivivus]|uniref:Uncharacterized protein n=1 Tax=Pedobacter hiemivivus TaxID=2530454 RepID=A0A4R0NIK4_9SPHI|nr:hypothetical protein [Pedobacter hiemivivus]TCC99627.1 hypothetical protein EZ444_02860 [Pedobacter hiemivivus]
MLKKAIPVLVILLGILFQCYAQEHTKKFKLLVPEQKALQSYYSSIRFIDSRSDTSAMGFVQTGMFNARAAVVAEPAFSTQLKDVFITLTDSNAVKKELLFQLRELRFSELTQSMSEKGTFSFRASLYAVENNNYRCIATIDTICILKSGIDVTNRLLKKSSNVIIDFLSANLSVKPLDSLLYTMSDIVKIDSIEKQSLKLYNASDFVPGLYTTYQFFVKQSPDAQISVKEKDGGVNEVHSLNSDGKQQKIKLKNVYAIVHNGKPYVATEYGYYPLNKRNDDFFYTGKIKVTASFGDILAASMFGVLGTILAGDANSVYEIKMDHVNGNLIPVKLIEK